MQTVVKVKGMMCKMCEKHVEDAVKESFAVKKVKASHEKENAVIVSKTPLDKELLKSTIESIGYQVIEIDEK